MGCYDGAEVCELVRSYILNQLKHDVDKESIGLYRDSGLGGLHNIPKPEIEKKRNKDSKNVDYLLTFSAFSANCWNF